MLRLVCCALAILSCACGSKDDEASPEEQAADNAATWSDTAKMSFYNGCMQEVSGAIWQRYCYCAVDKVSKNISYQDFSADVIGYGDKLKTNGIPEACVKWAKGE